MRRGRLFTKPAFATGGPTSFTQARKSVACVKHRYMMGAHIRQFFASDDAPPGTEDNPITMRTGYILDPAIGPRGESYCLESLARGRADLWVDDANYLHSVHLAHCNSTEELGWLKAGQLQYAFGTRSDTPFGRQLATNLSKAVSLFAFSADYASLEQESFRSSETCERGLLSAELPRVKFAQMEGLFLLSGFVAAAGVLLSLLTATWTAASARRRATMTRPNPGSDAAATRHDSRGARRLDDVAGDPHATEGELLRALIAHARGEGSRGTAAVLVAKEQDGGKPGAWT